MDGCIKNINREFLDILLKEQLLTDLQISHVRRSDVEPQIFLITSRIEITD
jgi:hypothetical protein